VESVSPDGKLAITVRKGKFWIVNIPKYSDRNKELKEMSLDGIKMVPLERIIWFSKYYFLM
jgi:hypothetical protein